MTDRMFIAGVNGKERARRFWVRMPLWYRANGEKTWREGTTENISRSGVLFRGETLVDPDTPIEMNMALPAEVSAYGAAEVVCKGIVVRTVPLGGMGNMPGLATTISHYRLIRP